MMLMLHSLQLSGFARCCCMSLDIQQCWLMTNDAVQVGPEDHVICALSGGVDSTVAATLVHKILGDRLHCVFVDNGLLRYKVCNLFAANLAHHHWHCVIHRLL